MHFILFDTASEKKTNKKMIIIGPYIKYKKQLGTYFEILFNLVSLISSPEFYDILLVPVYI